MSAGQVILATSAPPDRPEYARDFLTCLASPRDHRVAFSYQKRWFAEDILETLKGREALIVFCDPRGSEPEFDFLSVRHAVIEELVPASPERLQDRTPIIVVFRLLSLTAVTHAAIPDLRESWQRSLGSVDHRPRPKRQEGGPSPRFVFEHPALAEAPDSPGEQESWRVLSEELGNCETLKEAFFFRVGNLRRADAKPGVAGKPPSEQVGSLEQVYSLKPSTEYELPMDAYARSGKTAYSDVIAPTSSSEQLTVQAITQSSAGRASEAVLVLRAGEVKRAQVATLIVKGAEEVEHLVPRVEIATRIKPNLGLAAVLMLLITVGVVLGGLPKESFGLSDGALFPVKALGGAIVGGATLFALGRVPGVGKS